MTLGPLITDIEGLDLSDDDRRVLAHPVVGGVILFSRNYENPAQLEALTREIHALRSPPLLIAVDHEGGRVQRFREHFTQLPAAASIGELYDKDRDAGLAFARQCGWLMAAELRSIGVDFSFAPVLDVKNARSRIIDDRAFHADPHAVARIAHAYVRGMHEAGMAAVGKHFPGHGTVVADSHLELPIDERSYFDIETSDLVPFRLTADSLDGMMPAHIVYPAVDSEAAGYSKIWIQKILRQTLGFNGVVFSDDLNMAGATQAGDVIARAQLSISAGCDVILLCNDRASTEQLLVGFEVPAEPMRVARMMRMHGKAERRAFTDWQQDPDWIAANAAIALYGTPQELALGDDMLS